MSESILVGSAGIAALLIVGAAGIPIAFSMIAVSIIGMWYVGGYAFMASTLKTLPHQVLSEYSFAVIPMFILMGALASTAGITTELYAFAHRLFGRVRGGLLMATTVASGIFAAISGSTIVNASVFTRIALPEMLRFGYDRGISSGCIAAAGTFAALIPPSITLVIIAILTEASIGELLIAGVLPGLLTVFVYLVGIAIIVRIRPALVPPIAPKIALESFVTSLVKIAPAIALIVIVLGGIYTGLMFPSSAGAVGAAGALLIAIIRQKLTMTGLWDAIRSSASTTAVLFFIVIGGMLFSRFLTFSGLITDLSQLAVDWQLTQFEFILALCVLYLVLGMFIDTLSILLITIPVVFPVAKSIGMDAIWFGIIVVKLIEIAAITPPVGLNLFAVMSASKGLVGSAELMKGIIPFVLIELVVITLLILIPDLVTWLPSQMSR
jgi:tripartite ATP-independent transporter DctM subunit